MITCSHNVRFELRNVSSVTVSGLEFAKCFENHVLSVSQFNLKIPDSLAMVGQVLSIEESVANLDRVAFISPGSTTHLHHCDDIYE